MISSPPLIARAREHDERIAVVDSRGSFTYNDLLDASSRVATALLAGREDLQEERVAFLLESGFPWVATQWGNWRAGGIAVPLPLNSTTPELEYFVDNAEASTLVYDAPQAPIAAARGIRALSYDQLRARQPAELRGISPIITNERRAMILLY